MSSSLPRASVRDTLAVVTDIVAPNVAKGVILRRPSMVRLAERLKLDERGVRRMQKLRRRYGEGPLMLRVPGRSQALVLAPDDVHRVLAESPVPFSTASTEKRAALAHFEPKVSLISDPPERAERRRVNDEVLESHRAMHSMTDSFLPIVTQEMELLLGQADGSLEWEAFYEAWFRIVRRVVFGDGARDDEEVTELMEKLRAAGNWAFFHPKRRALRDQLHERLRYYLSRAEPGSLAAAMAARPTPPVSAPTHQMPQWLFAFDPAGIATFRALALLATHPEQAARAQSEIGDEGVQPYLRACVLEALRLWPTTPLVLRQSTEKTPWDRGVMPEDTGVLIYAPFFHRDETRLDFADRFAPEVWLDDPPAGGWPLIPFSDGPGICPGRHLVLLLTSTALATLLRRPMRLASDKELSPESPLPGTLDHFTLRFEWDL